MGLLLKTCGFQRCSLDLDVICITYRLSLSLKGLISDINRFSSMPRSCHQASCCNLIESAVNLEGGELVV